MPLPALFIHNVYVRASMDNSIAELMKTKKAPLLPPHCWRQASVTHAQAPLFIRRFEIDAGL
jgi:hypothetical protein